MTSPHPLTFGSRAKLQNGHRTELGEIDRDYNQVRMWENSHRIHTAR